MRNASNNKNGGTPLIGSLKNKRSKEVNEHTIKYYTLHKLVVRRLSAQLRNFSYGKSNTIDYQMLYKLGLDLTNEQIYAWNNTRNQLQYFKNKDNFDVKVFSKFRNSFGLVLDGLQVGTDVLKTNENLQTAIEEYETILERS